ncbi:intraflagellar transport protein 46 homolog [Leptidea sinapis]|uniref:intraflagellar transport protein 46 homolog n=1 Tax=Leptidea sinapis TaxID=189913 RepID=UPI00212B6ABA|nr:intraflagellar transport protein 46 homolog [Leptidea sinapis]
MTTDNKYCQTFTTPELTASPNVPRGMYDETVVVDATEIESPSSEEEVVNMSKFNPPARHTARHDFDSSESDSTPDKFDNFSEEDESPDRKSGKEQELKESKTAGAEKQRHSDTARESSNSESDSVDIETELRGTEPVLPNVGSGKKRPAGVVIPAEGAYDPKQFMDLKVPPEMENIFQYIMKYTPQKIDIEFKLQPFIPEYVPSVGDTDAFIKVTTPACGTRGDPLAEHALEFIENLGLTVLDEPAAEQSDSALLHLQLRAISKTSSAKSTVLTKKVEDAEKNPRAIERWIRDVSELHLSKPAPTLAYSYKMPDIESLMEEWPEMIEETLNDSGFPPANLDCSISEYVDIICAMFDIPIHGDTLNHRIQALHLLFSLYSAVKNSQLYADRIKEEKGQ